MFRLAKYLICILLLGCAQVTSLNLQKHQFGKLPTKIIWIQVAGFTAEHIALLKYGYTNQKKKTAFENAICIGNTWEYDLYNLRPSAYNGFLSQLTGKKNIKGQCKDYNQKPIWRYLENYKIGIFEGMANANESLAEAQTCNGKSYVKDTIFWSMNKKKKAKNQFHVNEKANYKKGKVYYDKSCLSGECFTSLNRNVQGTFQNFTKNAKNYLYIVRNFQFAKLLKKKKVSEARAELNEINQTLKYFQKLAKKSNDMLVLLSTAESIELDFPKSGREWKKYEKNTKAPRLQQSNLLSSVFANGARAENFCGIYDQNQLLSRIFSGAKQQGLEFSIINPFE